MNVSGSCLCGGVAFSITGPLGPVLACHRHTCRKLSGHHVAATSAKLTDIVFTADDTLTWYRSSDSAARGFCGRCGGNLLYRGDGRDSMSIHAGMLDGATGVTVAAHIFVEEKGDYHHIAPGERQVDGWPEGVDLN